MSISKEIFGIERKEPYTPAISGPGIDNSQFNACLDLIDQFELSEEELVKILNEEHFHIINRMLARAIIRNQSKIFVRKTK